MFGHLPFSIVLSSIYFPYFSTLPPLSLPKPSQEVEKSAEKTFFTFIRDVYRYDICIYFYYIPGDCLLSNHFIRLWVSSTWTLYLLIVCIHEVQCKKARTSSAVTNRIKHIYGLFCDKIPFSTSNHEFLQRQASLTFLLLLSKYDGISC